MALFVSVAVVIGLVSCEPSTALRAQIQARLAELKAKRGKFLCLIFLTLCNTPKIFSIVHVLNLKQFENNSKKTCQH